MVGPGTGTTVRDLYQGLARAAGCLLAPVHGPAKPGEQQRSVIDGSLIRRALGLPQPLSLAEGRARTAAWSRSAAPGAGAGGDGGRTPPGRSSNSGKGWPSISN